MRELSVLDLKIQEGISVVMPFYNEGTETINAITHVFNAGKRIKFPIEIIAVDDGSTNGFEITPQDSRLRVIKTNHAGRAQARLIGLNLAKYPNVLMLDARVLLEENSLSELQNLCALHPSALFWNGYLFQNNSNNHMASMWETLVGFGWKKITKESEVIHFGIDDFDKYPKGTGIFLTHRENWIEGFKKLANDGSLGQRNLSDDTRLLRNFAQKSDIWIDPKFSAEYIPRNDFKKFLSNSFYRGTTFVDSYWNTKSKLKNVVRIFPSALIFILGIIFSIFGGFSFLIFAFSIYFIAALAFLSLALKIKNMNKALNETKYFLPFLLYFTTGFYLSYLSHLMKDLGFQAKKLPSKLR